MLSFVGPAVKELHGYPSKIVYSCCRWGYLHIIASTSHTYFQLIQNNLDLVGSEVMKRRNTHHLRRISGRAGLQTRAGSYGLCEDAAYPLDRAPCGLYPHHVCAARGTATQSGRLRTALEGESKTA
jgi:hypothetical protein